MKLRLLLLPILVCIVVAPAAQAIDVTSRIDSVAVYPAGAMITRVAAVELPAGTTTVRLTGLINDLGPGRMRVEAVSGDVAVGQVRFEREQQRDAYNAEIERLDSEIRAAEERIAAIDDAVKSAELRLKFLNGIAEGYAREAWYEGARGAADVASWREALGLLESASADAYAEIRSRGQERTEAERDLSVLQRELESLRGGALASSTLEVTLRAGRAVSTGLRLHYFQPDAHWNPEYEARLDSDASRLTLVQQATVRQGTDEPWTDVALTLSTSDPSGALEPGTIDSEFLDLRDPRESAAVRKSMQGATSDTMVLEEVMVTGAGDAKARVGNFAVTYGIPGRVTVANNVDETQSFDVGSMDFDVTLVTRIMPRRSEQAFLAARFTYDRNVPLNASSLRVYVDGAYAGMTRMPDTLPQSDVTMPMGEDSRVDVRVVDQGAERGQEGIIGRRNVETTHYLFEITNRRPSVSQVEVIDRYPVARNEDIEVEVPRSATEPTEQNIDNKPGVIAWRKAVAAGETWQIQHRYTVTYPADKVLSRR